jgi:hypothetical protein
MGKLSACFAIASLALAAACGSDNAKADASIKIVDAAIPDMKVWNDAPPGPDYDFTCYGGAAPTTAADPITVAGDTAALGQNGSTPVPNVDVDFYETGTATPLATVVSDASGSFTTGNIATGGTPIDGYVRAMEPTFRSTYLYPPNLVTASLAGVPVVMIGNDTFGFLTNIASVAQDDAVNGALVIAVTDCSSGQPTPIEGATVKVQQGGTDVGTVFDLGQLAPQAAGTFFAFNVPEGATQILVSYDGMNFPTRTVVAHKKPTGEGAEGTITATAVRPGP